MAGRIPPSPPEHPRFGHLLDLRADPLGFLQRTARDYGGIVRLRFRNDIAYLVSEPDLLKELLIDNSFKYLKNTRYKHLRRMLGEGIVLADGESWKKQRKTAQPFFTPRRMAARIPETIAIAQEVLRSWESHAGHPTPIDTEVEFSRLAQRQALRFIVGPMETERADEIAHILHSATTNWPDRPRGRFAAFRPPPLLRMARLWKAIRDLDRNFYWFIDHYRREKPAEAGMLHALVEAQDTSMPLAQRNRELRDQLVTLFLAAFETSASAICWLFYLLDQHPHVRDRVHAEVDQVLGGRAPTMDDLPRLTYMEQVFNESVRMYMPIHAISRVAAEDSSIGGYDIPRGATVMVSFYATHRLPHHWPNPDTFDPDRFTPENSQQRHRYAFIPFSIGPRNCLGGHQALVNAKINISLIAQRYVLSLAPGHPVALDPRTTLRPRYGMQMHVHARKPPLVQPLPAPAVHVTEHAAAIARCPVHHAAP